VQNTYSTNGPGTMFWVIWCIVILFYVVTMWKIFTKAGQPGWAAIIPIYNLVVLHQIVGKPIWWIILYIIPLVGLIIGIIVTHALSTSFGKGAGFTVGLIFLGFIFYPILAWGESQYLGPNAGSPGPA